MWLLTHFALGTLAFNLYDKDGSGGLTRDEIEDIVASVYSTAGGAQSRQDKPLDIRAKQILDGMDVDGDGNVTKDEFVAMVNNYHYLLMPAFEIQAKVRQKLFGYFIDWTEEESRRSKMQYMMLVDIIRKIDETAQSQIVSLGGDLTKVRAKFLGDDYVTSVSMENLTEADARSHKEVKMLKDEAENDKDMQMRHTEHRVLNPKKGLK